MIGRTAGFIFSLVTTIYSNGALASNLWDDLSAAKLGRDIEHPYVSNRTEIEKHKKRFLANPDNLRRLFENSKPWLAFVTSELRKSNMPPEIAFVPMVESNYLPTVRSQAMALGMWQIVPGTANWLALSRTPMADARLSIPDSTRAALSLLNRNYERFGAWPLALAAYNMGDGGLAGVLSRRAPLPSETKEYVPKIAALFEIFTDRQHRENIGIPDIEGTPQIRSIQMMPTDIRLVSQMSGVSVEEIQKLNPWAGKTGASPWKISYLLPNEGVETMENNRLKAIESDSSEPPDAPKLNKFGLFGHTFTSKYHIPDIEQLCYSYRKFGFTHIVSKGDTLERISKEHCLNVVDLKRRAGIKSDLLHIGQEITLPPSD